MQVATWLNDEGLDLLEVSGGTYEQPKLVGLDSLTLNPDRAEEVKKKARSRARHISWNMRKIFAPCLKTR